MSLINHKIAMKGEELSIYNNENSLIYQIVHANKLQ